MADADPRATRRAEASVLASTLRRAHRLMEQARLREAEALCRRAVDGYPMVPEAVHLLALIRRRQGDIANAETLMLRSLELAPDRAEYRTNYGNLLRSAGRPLDAEREYRHALQLVPEHRTAQLGLVRLLISVARSSEAEAIARTLLARRPEDAEGWHELGVALRDQARLQEAEAAYRQALAINPGYAVARHNLGALLSQLKRAEEALEQLDAAASRGLSEPALHFNRARALQELMRFDEAEQALQRALQQEPNDERSLVQLVKLRFMRGEADFAAPLRRAVERRPGDLRLRLAHASLIRDSRDFESAQVAFETAIACCGPAPPLLLGLAMTLQEAGRPADALLPARTALEHQPGLATSSSLYHSILLSVGRGQEALPLIRAALAKSPLAQDLLALESTAARLTGDGRYGELCDYENFVRAFEVEPPPGYGSIEQFNEALLAALQERHRLATHPLEQSLRFGTQTVRSLLTDPDPVFRQFLHAVTAPIEQYRAQLPKDPQHPLLARNRGQVGFAGCWSVRLQRGGYHVNHVHPEGWLSSAYYVHTPADVADVDAQSGWIKFGEPRYPVPHCGPERFVQPHSGLLVLFPSYMWHGTTPITTDEPRITIAFDVVTR